MLDALYKGMTGLLGFSKSLDNLSNNVANLNTPGFKGNDLFFRELNFGEFGGQSQLSSGLPDSSGSGVTVAGSSIRFTQGDFLKTGNETDLAIDGQGLFVLIDDDKEFYTRAGQFRFDQDGYLVDPATGFHVAMISTGGELGDFTLDSYKSSQPQATQKVELTGSLDGTLPNDAVYPDATGTALVLKLYDVNGRVSEVNVRFVAMEGSKWQVKFEDEKGVQLAAASEFEFTGLGGVFDTQDSITLSYTPFELLEQTSLHDAFKPGADLIFENGFTPGAELELTLVSSSVVLRSNSDFKLDNTGTYTFDASGFLIDSATSMKVAALDSDNKLTDFSIEGRLETPAVATSYISLSGNLDSSTPVGSSYPLEGSAPLKLSYVDVSGVVKVIDAKFIKVADNQWSFSAKSDTGAEIPTSGSLYFNDTGMLELATSALNLGISQVGGMDVSLKLTDANGLAAISSMDSTHLSLSQIASDGKVKGLLTKFTFDEDGTSHLFYSNGDELQGQKLAIVDPADIALSNVEIDISGLRSGLAGQSGVSVSSSDGRSIGQVSLYSFDENGALKLEYSNGDSIDVGKLALAHVADSGNLESVGNTLYSIDNLQDRVLGSAGEGVFGAIKPENLELSNVELSREFSDIIIVQRGYQASSQVLTVTNELIEELYNSTRGR